MRENNLILKAENKEKKTKLLKRNISKCFYK